METKILICSVANNLRQQLLDFPATATVNAEYGNDILEGNVRTLASPACHCLNNNIEANAIGIATLSLDTLGGILAILGEKSPKIGDPRIRQDLFWDLVAFVSKRGHHRMSDWVSDTRRKLGGPAYDDIANTADAFWAMDAVLDKGSLPSSSDVLDITEFVGKLRDTLYAVFNGDKDLFAAGRTYRDEQFAINQASFKGVIDGKVIVRAYELYVNNLYRAPNGLLVNRIVGFNTLSGVITITLEHPEPGVNLAEFASKQWQSTICGYECIVCSPKDVRHTMQNALKIARQLATL